MKRIVYLFLLFFIPLRVTAQWIETAPNLLGSISQSVGAMTYSSGVVWAGAYSLWSSTDKGVTWVHNSLSLNGAISHIYFLDHNNGLVTTHAGEVYRTSDGGVTWKNILQLPSATSACFLDTSSNILVSEFISPGTVHFSRDGGATWNSYYIDTWIREIIPLSNGKAYLLAGDWSPGEHIWYTTNYGAAWSEQPGLLDADCWSFALDPCKPNRMYVVNEGYSHTTVYDGLSRIFISSDEGNTWTVTSNHHSDYYAGSITLGPHTIFCQTVSEANVGLVRSTDSGETWTNIGGPSSSADTRLIAAIDDNHVVAVDNDGSIWITSNSGGDSIKLPQSSTALVVSSGVAVMARNSCSSIDTAIPLELIECSTVPATIDSLWLTGSSAFQLTASRGVPRAFAVVDSIGVEYAPGPGLADTAQLHLRYDLGSGARDTTILLTGRMASPLLAQPARLHREAASAYMGQFDSLRMAVDISSNVNLDSLWPYISDIQATFAFDSSVVRFSSYNPPAGWTMTSLANRGNAVDFGIQKISAAASNPMDLGTALFLPNTTLLATSWVTLPRFVIDVGGKSLSLCVTDNEDSHWAVKTLGAQSGVAPRRAPTTRDEISIYPNPAESEFFVRNANAHPVRITMYDAIGRTVATADVGAASTGTINIESLPRGSYVVVCQEGDRMVVRRLDKSR